MQEVQTIVVILLRRRMDVLSGVPRRPRSYVCAAGAYRAVVLERRKLSNMWQKKAIPIPYVRVYLKVHMTEISSAAFGVPSSRPGLSNVKAHSRPILWARMNFH